MTELFTVQSLMTLGMLILLQAVLGFDNLLYISIESKRVEESKQQSVRRLGIGLAIVLRIVLLVILVKAIDMLKGKTLFAFDSFAIGGKFDGHSLIVLFGGAFILYTATKELWHMMSLEEEEALGEKSRGRRSPGAAIFWIVVMNLVFSFDSILSAMAIAEKGQATAVAEQGQVASEGDQATAIAEEDQATGVFPPHSIVLMATAIIVSGLLMIVLADTVSEFLKRNRMYEVLGLFVLFIVGVLLVSEGGHLAHIHLFSYEVEAMAKSTFYFVLVVLVLTDIVQGRYQRKLLAQKHAIAAQSHA